MDLSDQWHEIVLEHTIQAMMRYYWEALFSVEYFPYWEFTMLCMLVLNLSMLVRLNRLETMIKERYKYFKD